MGAGADAIVHHCQEYAALAQGLDQLVAGNAGTVRLEEYQIGLWLLHLDPLDLRPPACRRRGCCVSAGGAFGWGVQRENPPRSEKAGLPHRAPEPLLPAPDIVDEVVAAGDDAADR